MLLKNLMEAFASVSLEEAASAYREADGDPNKAAVILQGLAENGKDQTVMSSCSSGTSGSSSSSCSSDVFAGANCDRNPGSLGRVLEGGWSNGPVSIEDAEQFLSSMLGDGCELSMAVVKDVLCQCGYDVEKSKNVQSCERSANIKEDGRFLLECSDNLTDKASDSTNHSSESELQDNMWSMGYHCRNYSEVLAGSQVHSPTSPIGC
ncbi:hypothetical protein F0562_001120 [Nyssa sinensis]|uniref:At5g58720/SDE5-like UBA-like domain-containing protein n=1 Tax=Nyssa sinensis TaxID=561372 RepID=A0A5J5C6C1_9ASTE|nr:hypothetical protein F0562_001120 [Nyssa sinensis]